MAAALICLVVAAVSCRTVERIEVPVYVHDTAYVAHEVHDSVFVENTVTEYIKGDTVFKNSIKTKYKEKIVHDTVYKVKEVPVEVVKEKTEYVERQLSWLQKTLMVFGVCFIISVAAWITMIVLNAKKR